MKSSSAEHNALVDLDCSFKERTYGGRGGGDPDGGGGTYESEPLRELRVVLLSASFEVSVDRGSELSEMSSSSGVDAKGVCALELLLRFDVRVREADSIDFSDFNFKSSGSTDDTDRDDGGESASGFCLTLSEEDEFELRIGASLGSSLDVLGTPSCSLLSIGITFITSFV